jgi:hypothetical protein
MSEPRLSSRELVLPGGEPETFFVRTSGALGGHAMLNRDNPGPVVTMTLMELQSCLENLPHL